MSENNLYVYLLKPIRWQMLTEGTTPPEEAILEEHFTYLQDLTEKGVVLLAGRTTNSDAATFGLCLFRSASAAAARRLMQNDPAIRRGVMSAELFPFRIALQGDMR